MPIDKSKIYDELLTMKVVINYKDIPSSAYLQELIINCNDHQRKIEKHLIEATREFSTAQRMFRIEQLDMEVKKRQALINNEKIKKMPTGKEREAAVDDLFEAEHRRLLELENDVCAFQDLISSIKTVQYNLKGTNSDIKMLLRLMEQQVQRMNIGTAEDPEVKGLASAFAEASAMENELDAENVESSTEFIGSEPSEKTSSESEAGTPLVDTPATDSEGETPDSSSVDSFLIDDSSDFGSEDTEEPEITEAPAEKSKDVKDFPLSGTLCSVCGEPQHKTPGGDCCKNGHGGAPAKEVEVILNEALTETPASTTTDLNMDIVIDIDSTDAVPDKNITKEPEKKAESSIEVTMAPAEPVKVTDTKPKVEESQAKKDSVSGTIDIDDLLNSLDK